MISPEDVALTLAFHLKHDAIAAAALLGGAIVASAWSLVTAAARRTETSALVLAVSASILGSAAFFMLR